MRILVIQETDWLLRGPHQQHHLFERLAGRGHEVTVLDYPILRQHWPAEPLWQPRREVTGQQRTASGEAVRLIRPATSSFGPLARPSSMFTFAREIRREIRHNRPDVIVSYALSTGLPALRIARREGIPFVFHVIDTLHAIVPSALMRPVARQFERILFNGADAVLLLSEHLHTYALSMGAKPPTASVLRTGVDISPPAETQRDAVRQELGVGPNDVVLFFMGWLYDFAGLDVVAGLLPDLPNNVRLLVVGDGDAYEGLKTLRDTQLGERLILVGRVPFERIPAYLAAGDICVLPFALNTATEHITPIKLYEYMASSRPVLSSELPGVMHDVPPGNGVLYAPPAEWTPHIERLLDAPTRASLAAKARTYVEANYDWEIVTTEFENLLQAIAGSKT